MALKPRMPVRRFDVFAEYNRQKGLEEGLPEDEAAGYGLWVAKVVASRRFGGSAFKEHPPRKHGEGDAEEAGDGDQGEQAARPKWHALDGKDQTDELFDDEIVRRMGREFYDEEFVPAIRDAYRSHKSYQAIRDTLRKQWNPPGR